MNRRRRWLSTVAVLMLGAAGFVMLHASRPEPEQQRNEARPLAVFVDPVRSGDVRLDVSTQGEVRARTEIELVAEVSGRVLGVAPDFVPGGVVEPGAVLLRIDDSDYRFALARAEAGVAEAHVRVEQIKADAAVARRQLTPATATPLGLRKPQLADAEAKLRAAEAELEQARLDLARTNVRLPFRGRLRETLVNVGQYVSVGTPLGRAFATDLAEVRLPLTDQQLASLQLPIGFQAAPGTGPEVDFRAVVAGRERHWRGRITRLDAAVDPTTRLVHALAEVDDPYGAAAREADGAPFAVGLFVDAEIRGRALAEARVLPREALRSGNLVYVVQGGSLAVRQVHVVHENAEQVVVDSGVEPGEAVVVSPLRAPQPGMSVEGVRREVLVQDRERDGARGASV